MQLRKVEVFSAGCALCDETIALVNSMAGPSSEVSILDMKNPSVAQRAKEIGIRRVPAVVVDGQLAGCCAANGPTEEGLRKAGVA